MSFDPVMPPYNASDPTARFLSSSCLDFLLIELVPMTYRVTNQLEAVAREQEDGAALAVAGENEEGGNAGDGPVAAAASANGEGVIGGSSGLGIASATGGSAGGSGGMVGGGSGRGPGAGTEPVMDEEEEREAVSWRLEGIGYRIGQGLVERYVSLSPLPIYLHTSCSPPCCGKDGKGEGV